MDFSVGDEGGITPVGMESARLCLGREENGLFLKYVRRDEVYGKIPMHTEGMTLFVSVRKNQWE